MGIMWTVKHSNEALALSLAQAHVSRVNIDGGTGTDLTLITAWIRLLLDLKLWDAVGLSWEMPFGYKLTNGKLEKMYALKGSDLAQGTASKQATLTTGQNSRNAAQFTAANQTHYRGTTALPLKNDAITLLSTVHVTGTARHGVFGLEKNTTETTPFQEFSWEIFRDVAGWQMYRGDGTNFDQASVTEGTLAGTGLFNTALVELLPNDYRILTQRGIGGSFAGTVPSLYDGFPYSHYILGGRGTTQMMQGLKYGDHALASSVTTDQRTQLHNFWKNYYGV